MLEIYNLTKRFGGLTVFEDFSLAVPDGSFVVLLGPSGCGKTTLFNILTGLVKKDSGLIFYKNIKVENVGKSAAYMQQEDMLLPWMTLLENAALPARIAAGNRDAGKKEACSLLKKMGLVGFENYLPQRLSGGMRQRCALVRTIMFKRDLVLLDEPLSALDAITRRMHQSMLLSLQKDFSKTILMITHDVEEALLLADEIILVSRRPMRIIGRLKMDESKPRRPESASFARQKENILQLLQKELENETA